MTPSTETTLTRDCPAVRIPSGEQFTLTAGTQVVITPAADASATPAAAGPAAPVEEKAVWDQLRSCYDPEIPVNIVDLGLVYDCVITPREDDGARVDIKMTLTA